MRISFMLEKLDTFDIIKNRCPTGDKKEVFMLGIIGAMDEEVAKIKEQLTDVHGTFTAPSKKIPL